MLDFELSDDQKALVDTVRKCARDRIIPVAAKCDEEEKFPDDVFRAAFELGLTAPLVPEEYGGAGLSEIDHVLITEELGYACTGIQTSITANTLCATPLLIAGN